MKKSILFLSGAGIAAGVAIAVAATKKRGAESARGEKSDHADPGAARVQTETDRAGGSFDQQRAGSMKKLGEPEVDTEKIEIDDQGTDQESALAVLTRVRDAAFESSDEKLGLALGRPTEEVTGWLNGSEIIDGDVLLKARALAMQRGVSVP